jgi:hypothetical protein
VIVLGRGSVVARLANTARLGSPSAVVVVRRALVLLRLSIDDGDGNVGRVRVDTGAVVATITIDVGGEVGGNRSVVGDDRVLAHGVVATVAQGHLAAGAVGRSRLAARRSATSAVDRLNLGLNATTVRGRADSCEMRTDAIHQTDLALGRSILQSRLDDVVGVVVAQDALDLARSKELLDNHVAGRIHGAAEALLDDVGAELVTGQLADPAAEHGHNRLGKGGLVEVDDVLDHVVAEGVLDESRSVLGDLANEPNLLVAVGMVDAALQDAAAVAVGADLDAVVTDSVEDELSVGGAELVQALLNDVVAVEILDEIDDAVAESVDDHLHLGGSGDELDHLLQGTSAVLVESDADHVLGGILNELGAFLIIAEFEKLLAQVVAERIRHQLDDVGISLEPDLVDVVGVALLKLLLEVAAAVLVLAEFVDLTSDTLEGQVVVALHGWTNVSTIARKNFINRE